MRQTTAPVDLRNTPSCLVLVAALLLPASPGLSAAESGSTFTLASQRTAGAIDRIESALEVTGKLNMGPKNPPQETTVVANLFYQERVVSLDATGKLPLRSVRWYDKALASLKIGGGTLGPALRDTRRLVGVDVGQNRPTLFSPQGPLTREELDLIDVLGNSLLLDRLLPPGRVAVGEKWQHSGDLMALLLGLDTVSTCEAESALVSVADGTARLELSGKVSGKALGAATQIEIQAGKYHFDLRTGRITWFGLLVREKRERGQIEHGFEVQARLQMKIAPGASAPELADAALKPFNLQATSEATALVYESPEAGWRWLHDRRWYVASDDPKRTVFRLIDRGDYLAQCTAAPLDATAKDITIEQFQADLQRLLGQAFKQIVRTSEPSNPAGYRIYRVELLGDLDGLAVRWIYYRVAGPDGPPIIYAFTMEDELAQRFGESDGALVATVELLPRKVAAKPETAPKPPER